MIKKGFNFATTTRRLPYFYKISSVEDAFMKIPKLQTDELTKNSDSFQSDSVIESDSEKY